MVVLGVVNKVIKAILKYVKLNIYEVEIGASLISNCNNERLQNG